MREYIRKVILVAILAGVLSVLAGALVSADEQYYVVLDAGHGGYDSGCTYTWGGTTYLESNITLKIAKYCKSYLKKHAPNLKVLMTRNDDTFVGVVDRIYIALAKRADFLVSMHINDAGQVSSASGCMVLVSQGGYRDYLAKKEDVFTTFVLQELGKIGLSPFSGSENGRFYRSSTDGSRYPNGSIRDYYAIVAYAVELDFPGVIIEHGFLSNYSETMNHFSSDAQLRQLGYADAKAIIQYFSSEAASPYYGRELENQAGWFYKSGHYYYKDAKGNILKSKWLNLDGKYYYLRKSGVRATGFLGIGKSIYYFDEEGVAGYKLTKVGNAYYILAKKGKVRFKWYHTSADNYYYMYPKGHKKQGQVLMNGKYIIGGKVYVFNARGICTNYHQAVKATAEEMEKLEIVI